MTITHPFHPLCGRRVEVVRIRRGTEPDLIVRLPDGRHTAITMSWTDYTPSPALQPPLSIPHLLDFQGLRQIAQLLDRIRLDGCSPAFKEDEPHTSVDTSYS